MNAQTLILVGVAVVAILAALGAFSIAWRRSQGEDDWQGRIGRETRRADRARRVALPPAPLAEAASVTEHAEPAPSATKPERVSVVTVASEQRVIEVVPEEAGITRRQFNNRAISATFGSFMALMGIDMLAFMWPKVTGGFGSDVDAGEIGEILVKLTAADGSVIPLFIPEARAYIVPIDDANLSAQFKDRNVALSGVTALYQRCVHLGCRVPWCATSQGFECPCHGSKYDSVGEYFAGPAPRNLDRFEIEVKDDRLIIKTGAIVETPRAPVRSVAYPQGPSCIAAIAVEEV
jgi:cytochrome b6-f complex iron-sulfur subunit